MFEYLFEEMQKTELLTSIQGSFLSTPLVFLTKEHIFSSKING